jgi:chromosome partitioning protein
MIATVGNTKGGVGKTTLAVNLTIALAARGLDVLLVDGDEQGTALAFSELRSTNQPNAPTFTAVSLRGANIRTQLRKLAGNYAHVIIDVGGRDTDSLRSALLCSHLLVIPAAPRSFDLWGVDQTAEMVREARVVNEELRALAVLNAADVSGSDNREAEDALKELEGIELSPCRLVRRKAYPDAAAQGLSVLEYINPSNREGSIKAREDFAQFFDSIFPPTSRSKKIA